MRISLFSLIVFPLFFSFLLRTSRPETLTNEGSAVQGSFEILLDGGEKRIIEFHATRATDGTTSGETIFRDVVSENAPKPTPSAEGAPETAKVLFMKADVDCLVIEDNKAMMSGSIVESTLPQYVGRRVLIVAQEDRLRKGTEKHDRLTWGVYRNTQPNWIAQDQERPDEPTNLSRIATDAERPEDEGTPSNKEMLVGCHTFPLSSFAFFNAKQGHGSVKVKP